MIKLHRGSIGFYRGSPVLSVLLYPKGDESMSFWLNILKQNKGRITMIVLSVVVLITSVFGFTTAWFYKVETAKLKVDMEFNYVDIFVGTNGYGNEHEMIPSASVEIVSPNVMVNETEGTYCVFVQISELGGTSNHTYLEYATVNGWNKLSDDKIQEFKFPFGREDTAYYYRLVDAASVSSLDVLQSTVTVTANTTYAQIKEAWPENNPVKLQVVAAGCATTATSGLPTKGEVDYADVYTAFI